MGFRMLSAVGRDSGAVRAELEARGLDLHSWSNGANATYGWHEHDYHKTLVCLSGSIVFHTDDGDVSLGAGDVLELEPGTRHAATVGPQGVRCAEAANGVPVTTAQRWVREARRRGKLPPGRPGKSG